MQDGQTPPIPHSPPRMPGAARPATPRRIWIADRLDVRLRQRRMGPQQIRGLATALVTLHAERAGSATPGAAEDAPRRRARVREVCAALRSLAPALAVVEERERELLAELDRRAPALDARTEFPGACRLHGALHSAGIFIDPAGGTVVEPTEPADRRIGDPAEDLAALLVQVAADGEWDFARRLLAAYAETSGDFGLYPVIGVHIGLAALEAARAVLDVARGAAPAVSRPARASAERLLDAPRRLAPGRRPPRALVFAGVMASGKSTLSVRLAARLGVPRISGDALRERRLERVTRRGATPLASLTDGATDEVYADILRAARAVLGSGCTVVIDAAFPSRAQRAELRDLAARLGAELRFVECQADRTVVRRRLEARARTQRCDVQEWLTLRDRLLADWEPIEELPHAQHLRLDTSRDPKACLERVERWLGTRSGPHRVPPAPAWVQNQA
ncbi:AAA family ATPase [Myxococcota bacterium]|nr:AAA family ATPase [Myxococcota bacterium]MCZ7618172.1 AAA family ATPase [Myxococcota bacterium]